MSEQESDETFRYCHRCESVFHASAEMHGRRYHPGEAWKVEEFDDDPR